MNPDLQTLIDTGKLTAAGGRALTALEPGAYCLHKSWGFGKVAGWNLGGNQVLIDFGQRKSHPMQLAYAAETLHPVAPDHVLARKCEDLAGTRRLALEDPAAFVRLVLKHSPGGRATPGQIVSYLTPDVLTEAESKRWWEAAKKAMKKDGRFIVPPKKSDPIEARAEGAAAGEEVARLVRHFQSTRQLKDLLASLDTIAKHLEDFQAHPEELKSVLTAAGQAAFQNQRLSPGKAIELLIVRDEIAAAAGLPPLETPSLPALLKEEDTRLVEVIDALPATRQRSAFAAMPTAFGEERWVARVLAVAPRTHNARVVGEIVRLVEAHGRVEEVKAFFDRCLRDGSVSCEMLLYLCKEHSAEEGDWAADFFGARLFRAILSALDSDRFGEIKRGTKLRDLLLSNRELAPALLVNADNGEIRGVARTLLASPALEELDRRSLMGRLIRQHPALLDMLGGGNEEKAPAALVVSWSSLEKRKDEYDHLVNKEIPKNSQEIALARSYGDLRENFEFKAAKEMQTVLMRRKAELEVALTRARGTNFENPDVSQVSIGTVVSLLPAAGEGAPETYAVLGAWDGDPAHHIISYETAIGQALLGRRVGEKVELPGEGVGATARKVKIKSIKAYELPQPVEAS